MLQSWYYLTILRKYPFLPRLLRATLCCPLLLFFAINSFADGSRELTTNGGYRAYLFSSTASNSSFPFPTLGTMKVYVKAGETIYVGSSAQGIRSGTINLRAPDGSKYSSGSSATIGLISNRGQEKAGPLPDAGGYSPFTQTVQTGQEGIWEIDFVSPDVGSNVFANPAPIPADANWTQPPGVYIAAFDVSVRDAGNTKFIPGRVFTNVFSGILGTFNVGFNGILNILTKDGYQYKLDNNGQAGNGFTFFVNNKGFRDASNAASYQSINSIDNPNVQDPRSDDTQSDITQKIFFDPPALDLPDSAKTPKGTTWLLSTPGTSTISNVSFTGTEGTKGRAGTAPLGGNFMFNSPGGGTYVISIDVNRNGIYTDPADRKLTGSINAGADTVHWDGLDGLGNKVVADTLNGYNAQAAITSTAGEVHFPFFDVERNINGILLTRLNGDKAPDNTLYWDDTPIDAVGTPSNPRKNLTGINSLVNGHKWGSPASGPNDDANFGNNKGIDTWAYIPIPPVNNAVNFKLYEADLQVDSIKSNSGCTGQEIQYSVTVRNNGPDNVIGAKFHFAFSSDIGGVSVKSIATTGTSFIYQRVLSANAYDVNINLANGAVRTFDIKGVVALTSNGNLQASASILRPADVTDPDATDPDAKAPVDPLIECNSLPSGAGCNNIIADLTVFSISPDAGPDQTIYQYSTATITAAHAGTWSQAATDPALVNITNPSASSTTVTGLNMLGTYHFINTNINGCTDTVALTVITANIIIPNIFTPNNDGKNDVFVIAGLGSYPGSQLFIYNRWGNEVYRSDNYLNNWDGSGLAEGTYYYLLNRKDHDGTITVFKGWVFLKRSK
jgi:gliding motility-associated-like protein